MVGAPKKLGKRAVKDNKQQQFEPDFLPDEITERRDAGLRRLLSAPPMPHDELLDKIRNKHAPNQPAKVNDDLPAPKGRAVIGYNDQPGPLPRRLERVMRANSEILEATTKITRD